MDTGAKYTCYYAKALDSSLRENQFNNSPTKYLSGFIDNGNNKMSVVKYYQYQVSQFTIGNIDLGKQMVWVTFDARAMDSIIGMDILQQVSFLQYANTKEIHFFQSESELQIYVNAQ